MSTNKRISATDPTSIDNAIGSKESDEESGAEVDADPRSEGAEQDRPDEEGDRSSGNDGSKEGDVSTESGNAEQKVAKQKKAKDKSPFRNKSKQFVALVGCFITYVGHQNGPKYFKGQKGVSQFHVHRGSDALWFKVVQKVFPGVKYQSVIKAGVKRCIFQDLEPEQMKGVHQLGTPAQKLYPWTRYLDLTNAKDVKRFTYNWQTLEGLEENFPFTRTWACEQLAALSAEPWYQEIRKGLKLSTSPHLEKLISEFKEGKNYAHEEPELHAAWVDPPVQPTPARKRTRKAKEDRSKKSKDANDDCEGANQQVVLDTLKTLQEHQGQMQANLNIMLQTLTKMQDQIQSIQQPLPIQSIQQPHPSDPSDFSRLYHHQGRDTYFIPGIGHSLQTLLADQDQPASTIPAYRGMLYPDQ